VVAVMLRERGRWKVAQEKSWVDHSEDFVVELRRLGRSSIASPWLLLLRLSLLLFGTLFVRMSTVLYLSFRDNGLMMVVLCPDFEKS